ncbi:Gluconolactonase [Enhygromyxa salina]|uniref:Gluconolactonase n=1 Tax=Enhygromyxa salina TaxID=215803 RepID=A0A0C2DBZ3_9BACT|nr:Gluconolactonase [Enhygromyxa salina]
MRIYDPGFLAVLGDGAKVEELVQTNAHEGPVYLDGALYFTTVPVDVSIPIEGFKQVAIRRLDLDSGQLHTVREPSNMANGMTLDRAGNLIICEQGTKTTPAAISRLNPRTNEYTKLVEEWFGLPFNSPNDVVVRRDGSIWFTDPSYGFVQGFKPAPLLGNFVYRFEPESQRLSVVADNFNRPNGLAFSPDETILYINDSGAAQGAGPYQPQLPHHIRAFEVSAGGEHLEQDRLITVVTPGIPDGLKVDSAGRIYSSAGNGVQVYSPDGRMLGLIEVPGVANFTFGGPNNDTIYMMADTAIWSAKLSATGA